MHEVYFDVVIRVNSLQGETESLRQSAEVSRCQAADQSEQLLAVMTTLKDEHSQVYIQLLFSTRLMMMMMMMMFFI